MKMRNPVVAGIDASPEAAHAAAFGWRYATVVGATFHLVHAAHAVTNDIMLGSKGWAAQAQVRLNNLIRSSLLTAHEDTLPVHVLPRLELRVGRAAAALAAAVADYDAGLLVLGCKRHYALGRWLGGSTVHNVVQHVGIPVLVTVGAPHRAQRVLIALDYTAAGPGALAAARDVARVFGGWVRALHVLDGVTEADPERSDLEAAALQRLERESRAVLDRSAEVAVRCGVPAREIRREAIDWQADLIVLGSAGPGQLRRLLLGGVAEDLIDNPPASLLIVPGPLADRAWAPNRLLATSGAVVGG